MAQGDLQRVIVEGLDSQLVNGNRAGLNLITVLKMLADECKRAGRRRIHQTLHPVLIIVGSQRLAVAPLCVLSQGEGVNKAVIGDGVVGGHLRLGSSLHVAVQRRG